MLDAGALSPLHFALAIGIMALAGFVHGALGLGFPLVATPLLALFTDIKTAIVFALLPSLTSILISIALGGRPSHVLREYWTLPLYMIVGSYFGARLLIVADPTPFLLLLALVILAYLNLKRLQALAGHWITAHPHAARATFGLLAGVFESTANVAGPALLIYFLSTSISPGALVQALNLCFLTGKSTQTLTLAVAGGIPVSVWLSTVPFAVVGALGLAGGMRVRSRIPAETYRTWLRGALWIIAALLIAQFLWRALGR